MIERLHAAGAKEIVYDVQFTEPTVEREDLALYEAIGRAGGAVLATDETDGRGRTNVLGGDDNLARVNARAGSSGIRVDEGGEISSFPRSLDGLESLAVVTAERVSGRPVDPSAFEDGEALIDYRGPPGTFPTLSFSRVLRGRFPADAVRGKIVVVGATAPTLQDVHTTPVGGEELMSGPEVQANAIWTTLNRIPLKPAPAPIDLLAIALLALATPLARMRLSILAAAAVAPLLMAVFLGCAVVAFNSGLATQVVPPIVALLLATVGTTVTSHLSESRARRRAGWEREVLAKRVREATAELRDTQLEVVRRLAIAVESRDLETGLHIERISRLCERLGLAMGMSEDEAELLRHASPLHDVGKVGLPDAILQKPGKLSRDEWAVMKTHPTLGGQILAGSSSRLVRLAETIALTHHERWDGTGYPRGLGGTDIPLAGRICAVCDVFDALLSPRPYKDGWPLERVLAEIERSAGTHFDPSVVEAFLPIAGVAHDEWVVLDGVGDDPLALWAPSVELVPDGFVKPA